MISIFLIFVLIYAPLQGVAAAVVGDTSKTVIAMVVGKSVSVGHTMHRAHQNSQDDTASNMAHHTSNQCCQNGNTCIHCLLSIITLFTPNIVMNYSNPLTLSKYLPGRDGQPDYKPPRRS